MITGVLCWPVLMWRFVLPGNRREYTRRLFALLVCAVLLVSSLSRASMLAAGLSSTVPLVCTRRYRTLLVGLSLFAAVLLNLYLISPERFTSSADTFLYKKGEKGKILGSRQKPWERSLDTFQEHPWLGLGFGAADNSADWKFDVVTPGQLTRERGSSYLTMLESTGVLGTLPFGLLMLALLRDVRKVFLWLRHTGNPDQPAVVAATVILGCLVNAFFEDWIFAVGYYTSVFFWILALSLRDWMAFPARSQSLSVTERQFDPVTVTRSLVLR
jgi:O-antigen ligase